MGIISTSQEVFQTIKHLSLNLEKGGPYTEVNSA